MEGPDGTVHHNAHAPSSSGATAGPGSKNMKLAQLEGSTMPATRLLIGPLLRRVVGTQATVWVETSAPAVVTVRAVGGASGTAPTFSAYDHHYALVVVEGLAPESAASYEVMIDDEMAWPVPESGFPPSVIRTRADDDRDQPVRLIFGSCRETTQHAATR